MTPRPDRGNGRTSWRHKLIVALAYVARIRDRSAGKLVKLAEATAASAGTPLPAPEPPAASLDGVTASLGHFGEWPVWRLEPQGGASRAQTLIYFHGGAYIAQMASFQWTWIATLVRELGCCALVPLYPLAPRGTAALVIPEAADLVAQALAPGAPVSVIGDSAGGGLALAVTQELVRRGGAQPAHLLLIAPWLDATLSDPRSLSIDDPLMTVDSLRWSGRQWAGELDPAEGRVSPLFASMEGLPPVTVFAGTRDILYPDTARLEQRSRDEGLTMAFITMPGLVHGWPVFTFLPEARAALPRIVKIFEGFQ
ncbi:MAG: alpha/beta hydrolase fold domain-containing protein [Pseudomonadota bacterium]|uniref:alpha/beta hydrolase fold domain-containing protein n=1 Tax=Sphingomonas sp. ERG5 TaxID=1381597 RepID=UPI00068B514C|nr:alpha/beta hydrolase fold domain-containing protein [Sphingomonas sp. ERG5]